MGISDKSLVFFFRGSIPLVSMHPISAKEWIDCGASTLSRPGAGFALSTLRWPTAGPTAEVTLPGVAWQRQGFTGYKTMCYRI